MAPEVPADVRTEFGRALEAEAQDAERAILEIMRAKGPPPGTKSLRAKSGSWDEGKHPRSHGKFSRSPGGTNEKPARPAAPDHPDHAQTEKLTGTPKGVAARFAALGQKFLASEHAAKEQVNKQLDRLPRPVRVAVAGVYHAAFATYTAAQGAVKAVAKERGLSPEHVDTVASIVSKADLVCGGKLLPMGLTAAGLGAVAPGAAFVPVASLAYLGFSTAKDPLATWRAAKGAVSAAMGKMRGKAQREYADLTAALLQRAHESTPERFEQWAACFFAALEATEGDARKAVEVADAALEGSDSGTVAKRLIPLRKSGPWDEQLHPRDGAGRFGRGHAVESHAEDRDDADDRKEAESYLEAFNDGGPVTADEVNGANAELEEAGIDYRIVPKEGGSSFEVRHNDDLKDEYGAGWVVERDPETGKLTAGDQEYFVDRKAELANDPQAWATALNKRDDLTEDDIQDVNDAIADEGGESFIVPDEDGKWVVRPEEEIAGEYGSDWGIWRRPDGQWEAADKEYIDEQRKQKPAKRLGSYDPARHRLRRV